MAQLWFWKVSVRSLGFAKDLATQVVERKTKAQRGELLCPEQWIGLGQQWEGSPVSALIVALRLPCPQHEGDQHLDSWNMAMRQGPVEYLF